MAVSLFRQFCADARFYRQLERPGKPVTAAGALLTALSHRGLWLLAFHRIAYYSTFNRNIRNPLWWLARVTESAGAYLGAVLTKSEILGDCEIPGRVYLSGKGRYMFGAKKVGAGSIIHHHVTFGLTVTHNKTDRPTVGTNVWIGPDCVIAGKLHIGDGATILPGSYLTHSVPERCVVQGNPARVIGKEFDNSALRRSLDIVTDIAMVPAHSRSS